MLLPRHREAWLVPARGIAAAPHRDTMGETEKIQSRAKQRVQQIQKIQRAAGRGGMLELEDTGEPAEDDDVDAVTRFAHEVRRAKERAANELRGARRRRPR